ncbi:hypothetical protein BKA65DRAFT_472690 [Rhexocercosporidium sp. MPI-PUGE-AT-0058]|nr:hypothetical protein BKA65DRAFT_472690 [Rhexocercosporidium sp. MPI-PUGE-AT-0058]
MRYISLPSWDSTNAQDTEETSGFELRSDRYRTNFWFTVVIITSFTASIAGIYAILNRETSTRSFDHCGISPDEAVSFGCHFDIISFTWVPYRCFDEELTNRFLELREWEWFLDPEGVQPADMALLHAGEYDVLHGTWEYHMYHCTYLWRKMHRAFLGGQVLDGYVGSMRNTEHCEQVLLQSGHHALNETTTTIFRIYEECPVLKANRRKQGGIRL